MFSERVMSLRDYNELNARPTLFGRISPLGRFSRRKSAAHAIFSLSSYQRSAGIFFLFPSRIFPPMGSWDIIMYKIGGLVGFSIRVGIILLGMEVEYTIRHIYNTSYAISFLGQHFFSSLKHIVNSTDHCLLRSRVPISHSYSQQESKNRQSTFQKTSSNDDRRGKDDTQ